MSCNQIAAVDRAQALAVSTHSLDGRVSPDVVKRLVASVLREHGGPAGVTAELEAAYDARPQDVASRMRRATRLVGAGGGR